jgi:hypothetical protein
MEQKKQKNNELKDIEQLKISYELLKKKYALPDFKVMNDTFEIENIDGYSELILKAIRKHMTEKIFYVLRSLEMFLNAQNAPLFIFNVIKQFSESEKELISELYQKTAGYEIEAFGLEAEYDEKKEAEFIKKFSQEWASISADLKKIYLAMKEGHKKDSKKTEKSYFG